MCHTSEANGRWFAVSFIWINLHDSSGVTNVSVRYLARCDEKHSCQISSQPCDIYPRGQLRTNSGVDLHLDLTSSGVQLNRA